MFSTPEKIFEIFATIKKDDELYMSYNDLFRAICPFNYSDSPDVNFFIDRWIKKKQGKNEINRRTKCNN